MAYDTADITFYRTKLRTTIVGNTVKGQQFLMAFLDVSAAVVTNDGRLYRINSEYCDELVKDIRKNHPAIEIDIL